MGLLIASYFHRDAAEGAAMTLMRTDVLVLFLVHRTTGGKTARQVQILAPSLYVRIPLVARLCAAKKVQGGRENEREEQRFWECDSARQTLSQLERGKPAAASKIQECQHLLAPNLTAALSLLLLISQLEWA